MHDSPHERYDNPLITRYATVEMAQLFSPQRRIATWRRLWVALAEAQRGLGLDIANAQIEELREHINDINFDAAAAYEKRLRHDVMAHVHAYGDVCPAARAIIHLGATSCYVTDNADLIIMREALALVRDALVGAIDALAAFAAKWKALPCLGYTHFQPAQLVTVGKRATLWCFELVLDLEETERRIERLPFLGVKGTTGTQASFLALFDGDHAKVEALELRVAQAFGFDAVVPVSGQTYARKLDTQILGALAGIAESAHRLGTDLRLLAHEREVEEPYENDQIGSSAMAYKRNPMRAERMCSLARWVLALHAPTAQTSATQWLERSLDDSAIRRLTLPQAFLGIDAILSIYLNIIPGLHVNEAVVARHVWEEIGFIATENILMAAVKAGGDRQALHERIRLLAFTARRAMTEEGMMGNRLLDSLEHDADFAAFVETATHPRAYVGRSEEQVEAFVSEVIGPIRARYPHLLGQRGALRV
jgi:adenylosuccinate lyase